MSDVDKDLFYRQLDLHPDLHRTADLIKILIHKCGQLIEICVDRRDLQPMMAVSELQADCRKIIELRRIADKVSHALPDAVDDIAGRLIPVSVQRIQHAVKCEHPLVGSGCLRHAVGIQEQLVAGHEPKLDILISHIIHRAENETVFFAVQLKFSASAHYGGILVTCIGTQQPSG